MTHRLLTAILLFWFSGPFLAQAETALPDESQPITVEADELISQDQTGESVYTGHVTMVQGSTRVSGDQATVFHPERELEKTIVTGQPAHFRRFLPEQQAWMEGHADKITYSARERTVLLEGNAYVKQAEKNSIEGQKIFYDLKAQTVKAYRSETEQVQVIFDPATEDESPAAEKPTPPTETTP
ncbi:lipopolysaccharide transport periplasmic protein LptA [Thiomicrospira sp. WB1]|jgi:lipopolysaccharide export system protein LptA|uniref:lipopolysaccharide transport periplasmic protein LptA n=1 Tax=Thiomicrospira sp. WB1 TaxID=1685380 RepID=UPI000748BFD7|nr:lipopolysaccharide transport periplasmic protein LptA [Thiomicrospira sp. WB1]KUJ72861.1 OstA-like protein [Thiomicrospira sp. WB1]